jgi:hypothetical protein
LREYQRPHDPEQRQRQPFLDAGIAQVAFLDVGFLEAVRQLLGADGMM